MDNLEKCFSLFITIFKTSSEKFLKKLDQKIGEGYRIEMQNVFFFFAGGKEKRLPGVYEINADM